MYLVAVLDWYSRYILYRRLSNTHSGFCNKALEGALIMVKPEIFKGD